MLGALLAFALASAFAAVVYFGLAVFACLLRLAPCA